MNASLDFTSRLEPEEHEYTIISLEVLKNDVLSRLNIVDVAKKLGIELRQLSDKERGEEGLWAKDVYAGNCPACSDTEWSLRIFSGGQNFWCHNCHWEDETEYSMDIFKFLEHCSWVFPEQREQEEKMNDEQKIEKLFELYPEELSFLQWRHLNRYQYKEDYTSLADDYYKGIENDLEKVESRVRYLQSQIDAAVYGSDRDRSRREYNTYVEKREDLERVIEWHRVISKISSRREKVDQVLERASPSDIGREGNEWHKRFLANSDWSLPNEKPAMVGFDSEAGYMEITDASFQSDINRPALQDKLRDPRIGNYIIAYSVEENNFSIFLSPESDVKKLREESPYMSDSLLYHKAFTIENVMTEVEDGMVYNSRFPSSGKRNTPELPTWYREVATGGWMDTGIGMYMTLESEEYSHIGASEPVLYNDGKETVFDRNLLLRSIEGVRNFPVFTRENKAAFIEAFNKEVWNPRCAKKRTTGF